MKDNVIQFPVSLEREWSEHEDLIRSSCKNLNLPEDFTDELCGTMKKILLEVNKVQDFSVSFDGDIRSTVENTAEQVSAYYKLVVKGLLGEIVRREFKLYKCRKEHIPSKS